MGKKGPKPVKVKRSKPHRRRATWVKGYFRRRTKKAFRNKPYTRNKRRTNEDIALKGTRKEQKRRNVKRYHFNKPKPMAQTKLS